jgi:hypothetical protein
MRLTGGRKRPIALLYVIALALLVEGAGYLIVRICDNDLGNGSQRHLYSAIRGHELNPDYRRAFDTGGRQIHSAHGFRRDGLIELAKPEGTFRIFVLGGSALYGIGVQGGDSYPAHPSLANDETITFFLERDLNSRVRAAGFDVDVEVINAGVTAYQTFQHVLYFSDISQMPVVDGRVCALPVQRASPSASEAAPSARRTVFRALRPAFGPRVVSRRWWKLARRGSGTAWWSGSGGEVKVDG